MQYLKTMQILLLLAAVAVQSYPSNPHRPNPYKSQEQIKDYAFSYEVKDKYVGLEFNQDEKSEQGLVQGNYAVQLPDGRKQIVNYQADQDIGFLADVVYEGTASYPSGVGYGPITDVYAPNKESYSPPKRHQTTKQPYVPKIENNFPKKIPPKRYQTTKQPYVPKRENNFPKRNSYIPKKEIYTPQFGTSQPPKDTFLYKPVELSQPIHLNQVTLRPSKVGKRKVKPTQNSYQPDHTEEFESLQDPYPIPLDIEIPDMFKDILTSNHQRNVKTPELISKEESSDAISERFTPSPSKELQKLPPLHPKSTNGMVLNAGQIVGSEIKSKPATAVKVTRAGVQTKRRSNVKATRREGHSKRRPSSPKVTRTGVQAERRSDAKPKRKEGHSKRRPISPKVTRTGVQAERRSDVKATRRVNLKRRPVLAKVTRKGVQSEQRSEDIKDTRTEVQSKHRPVAVKASRTGVKTVLIPERTKVTPPKVKSESTLERENIQPEGRSEPFPEETEVITPKATHKQISGANEEISIEDKSEPLPVAAKIIRPKTLSASMDKPQYVKKPGLFKRENEDS